MEPGRNPYAPGAGTPPPTLAGRDALLAAAKLALERVHNGRSAKSFIAVGLRGVGKTVIMNQIQQLADEEDFRSIYIEAFDEIRLADALTKSLRPVLLKLSKKANAHDLAIRALAGLRSFASAFNVSYQGVEMTVKPEEGLADTGDMLADLPDLLLAIGEAARISGGALAIIIDEIQYLSEMDMSALIMAIHRCNQKSLPVVMFGAGLPQLRGKMGDAKSYVERLLDFPHVDALSLEDARLAIEKPANDEGVSYTSDALDEILRVTSCYPYFLRFIQAGRAHLRQALYMPALAAIRFNADMKAKYQALIAVGKPPKVAITAIMRKLAILASVLLREGRPWHDRSAVNA